MGIGVSGWRLARAVSKCGQLGVVSGTALDTVFARTLQLGDPEGHARRAMDCFPFPDIAKRVKDEYFIPGGKAAGAAFKPVPLYSMQPSRRLLELTVLADFVEVFLAKEGHRGAVGINLLEKIQLPTLPSLFGAMLAGVDYVLMGAGIPRAIPGILDELALGRPVKMKLDVEGAVAGEEYACTFDPVDFCGGEVAALQRPRFIAIVSSATLAMNLARKSSGTVDGFVVEGATAGGHNAPPRGAMQLTASGEPIYGQRDAADLEKIAALGLPFWLAGSFGQPGTLNEALRRGAAGIQVGTAFAFCEESGVDAGMKRRVLQKSIAGTAKVFTDPVASPTGFPFKIVPLDRTLSEPPVYADRKRVCDMGYLRHAYRKEDGSLGYRCPGEPVDEYVRKGGKIEDTVGRKCLCNGLTANVGLAQSRGAAGVEQPLLTAGDDVDQISRFLKPNRETYSASDVIERLLT